MEMEPHNDEALIRQLLERYAQGWRTADVDVLISTWDPEYNSLYLASEKPAPIHGYSEIKKYYQDVLALYPITKMEISNVAIESFGDLASAFCDIESDSRWQRRSTWSFRATFLFRRNEAAWMCIQYHESIKYEVPQG